MTEALSVLTARVWAQHPHWNISQVRSEISRRRKRRRVFSAPSSVRPVRATQVMWWDKE